MSLSMIFSPVSTSQSCQATELCRCKTENGEPCKFCPAIKALEKNLIDLKQQRNFQRDPLQKLPAELRAEIFKIYCDLPLGVTDITPQLYLTLVCKAWRTFVFETSALWKGLYIQPVWEYSPFHLEQAIWWLELSKKLPLSLHFGIVKKIGPQDPRSSIQDEMKKATKQIADAVVAHQDRIQSLNISNHYDLREGLYGGLNSQALSVNMWISLSHILIESLTPVETLRVLSASPQATCVQFPLIVDLCEESPLFPVVSCNRLRALEVGFDQQSTEHMYDTFFTNFMAPGLKTLICHSTDPCPVSIIDMFLRKSGAELTAIHLEHAVFERTPFSDFLNSPGIVKSLKSLSLALHPANVRHEYEFHLCSTKASLETVIRLLHLNLDGQLYGKSHSRVRSCHSWKDCNLADDNSAISIGFRIFLTYTILRKDNHQMTTKKPWGRCR